MDLNNKVMCLELLADQPSVCNLQVSHRECTLLDPHDQLVHEISMTVTKIQIGKKNQTLRKKRKKKSKTSNYNIVLF